MARAYRDSCDDQAADAARCGPADGTRKTPPLLSDNHIADTAIFIFFPHNAAVVPRAMALRRCESEPTACWATDRNESNEIEAALPSPSEQQRSDRVNATCSTAPPALRQTKNSRETKLPD